jgi:Na+/melibiose symporter-like transporter
MSTKLALAVAVLLAFSLLDWLGTSPEEIGNKYDPVVLALIYAALPIVLKLGSIVLVWRYPLSRSEQEAIKMRLSRSGG